MTRELCLPQIRQGGSQIKVLRPGACALPLCWTLQLDPTADLSLHGHGSHSRYPLETNYGPVEGQYVARGTGRGTRTWPLSRLPQILQIQCLFKLTTQRLAEQMFLKRCSRRLKESRWGPFINLHLTPDPSARPQLLWSIPSP